MADQGVQVFKIPVGVGGESPGVDLTVVAEDGVQGLEAEVPALSPALDLFQKLEALDIVVEVSRIGGFGQAGEKALSVVAKGG